MVAWSNFALKNIARYNLMRRIFHIKNDANAGQNVKCAINYTPARDCHKVMVIHDSQFVYKKLKDLFNFYLLLGLIPITLVVTYCNIFIGPAKLALIPEGYEPKVWEYHQHPISRFFAKYCSISPQEAHERSLHNIFYQNEKFLIRGVEKRVEQLMQERLDYQAYYTNRATAKYFRKARQIFDENEEFIVQSHGWVK